MVDINGLPQLTESPVCDPPALTIWDGARLDRPPDWTVRSESPDLWRDSGRSHAQTGVDGRAWRQPSVAASHLRHGEHGDRWVGVTSRDRSRRGRCPQTTRCGQSGRGGARTGRGSGISVGRPRCRSIRWITAARSMSAISRNRPPQRGHANTSYPNVRPSATLIEQPARDAPARSRACQPQESAWGPRSRRQCRHRPI